MLGLCMILIFLLSFILVSAVSDADVNEYALQVASLLKEKCHGDCEKVVMLGDDYVIPSFRRDVKFLNWNIFFSTVQIDKILTDIGYVQRKSRTFADFDDLFKVKDGDKGYEGKNVLFILPDNMDSKQKQEVERLKQIFRDKGYNPDFEAKNASDVSCNDPGLFSDFNGRTLFVIGTEQNNYAYNCFPFQAGLENRDAAFIDINPWRLFLCVLPAN